MEKKMSNIPFNNKQQPLQTAIENDQNVSSEFNYVSEEAIAPPNEATPEVKPTQPRRSFTAKYKLKILDELDRCIATGDKGALLRREGLYSSHIAEWRSQRAAGTLGALNKVRGRKKVHDKKDIKISNLEKQVDTLTLKLTQAEAIIDVQKKISEIFGAAHPSVLHNEKTS